MADFIVAPSITIIPNIQPANAIFTDLSLGDCVVRRITVTFPPGPMGNVGVIITMNQTPIFPNSFGDFAVFDDYIWDFTVTNQPTTGKWGIFLYNTDTLSHTIQVIFYCDYVIQTPQRQSSQAVSL